jgi:hypothetical protein
MATKASFSPSAGLAAIAKAFSHGSETGVDVETLKTLAIFCGLGLAISLLLLGQVLDMGAEFF